MTCRRLGLLVSLTLGILWLPLAADAQRTTNVPTIGVLLPWSPPAVPDWKQHWGFLQELHTLGWREGEPLAVEYRWASGQFDRAVDLIRELVQLKVDVVVVDSLTWAAQRAATTSPMVLITAGDPAAEGFVAGLARPGGHMTGVAGMAPALNSKLLELLKEAVPAITRIAVLVDPIAFGRGYTLQETRRAAQALDVQLHVLEARHPHAFERAFAAATQAGDGALLILPSVLFGLDRSRLAALADLAAKHRLPAIYWQRAFAEAGGLLAYGPNIRDLPRRAASYVDRILKGAKPADLPVERPTTFELVINLKTAQALGLAVPPSLLFQATEVIR
jgi:putative tryptophan/tyrosine transport system substrate-binding protein